MKKDFIYLASASPRRRELLEQIGVAYRVLPAEIAEMPLPAETPECYVRRLASEKAEKIWSTTAASQARPVLAADTTVVLDGRMLGKPGNLDEALEMLAALSGRAHRVLTGVALRSGQGLTTAMGSAEVRFRNTSAAERAAYCATDEPFDKAGAYAIQGRGAVFVENLVGSFSAVVGLPLAETAGLLVSVGQPHWLAASGAER